MQLTYSAEIEAIRTDAGFSKPVVALESTIITHGMPYPQNLDVANKGANVCAFASWRDVGCPASVITLAV